VALFYPGLFIACTENYIPMSPADMYRRLTVFAPAPQTSRRLLTAPSSQPSAFGSELSG